MSRLNTIANLDARENAFFLKSSAHLNAHTIAHVSPSVVQESDADHDSRSIYHLSVP